MTSSRVRPWIGLTSVTLGLWMVGAGLVMAGPASPTHVAGTGRGMGSLRAPVGAALHSKSVPIRVVEGSPPSGPGLGTDQSTRLLYEGFETPWPSGTWRVIDKDGQANGEYTWARHSCRRYAGSFGGWAVGGGPNGARLACGAAYPSLADSWAIAGPFDLSATSAAALSLRFWVNTECQGPNCATAADKLYTMASTDGDNFDGPWVAGNWITNANADANGWVYGTFDMKDFVGKPQVWIALVFQSNSEVTVAGGGAFVDEVELNVTPTSCPHAATVRSVSPDRSCYVPGAQIGALVDVATTRPSQQVRAVVRLLSGDIGIAEGEATFTAPGQRVIPVTIPSTAAAGDYTLFVTLYDVAGDCIEDFFQRTIRIDPACRPTDPVPGTPMPTGTPTPMATHCPALGIGTYITTDDNENNAHTGAPDNDMYPGTSACIENTDAVAPIEFLINVPSLPASFSTARLLIYAYDVDEESGEVDEVYFDGRKVGTLTGADGTWSTSVFNLDPTSVGVGQFMVEIRINTTNDQVNKWCTKVDWGQLVLGRGGGAASLATASIRPLACRPPGSTVVVDYDVNTTLPSQEVRVEVNIVDSKNTTVAATSRTYDVNGSRVDPKSEDLVLPSSISPGTYTVTIIVFDTCSAAQQDLWTGSITITSSCAGPTHTPMPTPSPSPTPMPCPPLRQPLPPSCSTTGYNFVRNAFFEKGGRSWGWYHSAGRSIISGAHGLEGFNSATFDGRLGEPSRQILYQFIDIPLDIDAGTFSVQYLDRYGAKVDPAGPLSGRDFFRASIYDVWMSTELVRMWQFDPMSPCDADPSSYNFGDVDLARIRGRTVVLVFEFNKATLGGWYGGVVVDGIHLDICSSGPPCQVGGDKVASPSVTTPGGEATVMLDVSGYGGACLPARRSPDVMLVVDRSGSMNDFGGLPIVAARASAKAFVDRLDLSSDQVGLVSFANSANLDRPLSGAAGLVRSSIDALLAAGETNMADALLLAQAELESSRHRAANQPVMVLLSDGRPNVGIDPRAAAAVAKQRGTRIFTIGLGNAVDPDLLRELASSPSDYFFSPDAAELAFIYEQIAGVINGSPATNLTLVDRLSPYVTLVPGSFTGSPLPEVSPDGRVLTWRLPRLGLETRRFSYRVTLTQQIGTWPTNDSAVVTYTNSRGQPGSLMLPVPQVTVRPMPPTTSGPPMSGHPQLACRDHPTDNGTVPSNPNGEAWWDSPDIWVRNQPDRVDEPQYPIVGRVNTVYVRVRNIGDTLLTDIKVHLYASPGSASIRWPNDWAPEIGMATVDSLGAGETAVVSVPWTPLEAGHYCFLARLEAPADPITQDGWVPFDNNLCQRNVQILDAPGSSAGPTNTGCGFGNRQLGSGYGSISLRSSNFPGAGSGTLSFKDPAYFDKWRLAGGGVTGGTVDDAQKSISFNARGQGGGKVDLKIDRLPLEGEETGQLDVNLTLPAGAPLPRLDLVQFDGDGNPLGGSVLRPTARRALYLPSLGK